MVKAYLRYEPNGATGVVTSAEAIAFAPVNENTNGRGKNIDKMHVLAARLEKCAAYNERTGNTEALLAAGGTGGGGGGGGEFDARATSLAAVTCIAVFPGSGDDGRERKSRMGERKSMHATTTHGTGNVHVCVGDSRGFAVLWTADAAANGYGYVERARILCAPPRIAGGGEGAKARRARGVMCCSFSGGGEMVVCGGGDGGVSVIDAVLGSCECRLKGHTGAIVGVEFVSGSQLLRDAERRRRGRVVATSIAGGDGRATTSGAATGIQLDIQSRLSFVVSASRDGTIRCWDIAAKHCVQVLVFGILSAPISTDASINGIGNGNAAAALDGVAAVGAGGECVGLALGEMGSGGPLHAVVLGNDGNAKVIEISATRAAVDGADDTNLDPKVLFPVPDTSLGKRRNPAEQKPSCIAYLRAQPTAAENGDDAASSSASKYTQLVTASSWIAIACGKTVEVWRACPPSEVARRAKRRLRRKREKLKKKKTKDRNPASNARDDEDEDEDPKESIGDMYHLVTNIRAKAKVRALSLAFRGATRVVVGVTTSNNQIEVHDVNRDADDEEKNDGRSSEWTAELSNFIQRGGHRTAVRSVCISGDDSMVVSCCNGAALVWDAAGIADSRALIAGAVDDDGADTGADDDDDGHLKSGLLRSVSGIEYAVSSVFMPDNRHIVIGEKGGAISLVDGATGTCIGRNECAHDGCAVWALGVATRVRSAEEEEEDGGGGSGIVIVSGGEDKSIKVWRLTVVDSDDDSDDDDNDDNDDNGEDDTANGSTKKSPGDADQTFPVEIELVRSMDVGEDVLDIKVSPNGKFIAVALLDSTIKLYFFDTFKFFLSMYGHSLPALSVDFSSDGVLLASAGGDKNLRIWGTEFGDCHRSLRAHDDTITRVAFVPDTHYIFTCSKDRSVKYWDGDRFEQLLTLDGNHAEVWCMAVSSNGGFFVTGGADRSVRRWDRTDEPFFLEEEREKRFDAMFEAETQQGIRPIEDANGSGLDSSLKTGATLTAADSIIEALELAEEEIQRRRSVAKSGMSAVANAAPSPLLLGASPLEHVMKAVRAVKPSELEQVLMCLPFTMALQLLHYLTRGLNSTNVTIELPIRAIVLLLRLHAAPLTSTASTSLGEDATGSGVAHGGSAAVLRRLADVLRPKVKQLKDLLGFNLAGLSTLERALTAANDAPFSDATLRLRQIMEEKKEAARERAIGTGARRKKRQRKEADEAM